MNSRRHSLPIRIGRVTVGGDAPISVQSMTKTDTRDARATIEQINELEGLGCDIIRVAVPDQAAADSLPEIIKNINIPLVADIHFDYRLALSAIKNGVDALRLNPGNIGDADRVKTVVTAAKERAIPIRIGVNAGSLPPATDATMGIAQRMVEAALSHIRIFEDLDFNLIKVSLKAFDIPTIIEAHQLIARQIPYPIHIGVTEAGTPRTGIIRSAVGIGNLLAEGIGDTIRVSLSAHPREEVFAGIEILKSLNLLRQGPVLVSCPTCGRTEINLIQLAEDVAQRLAGIDKPIKVAVMGCVVNGPGEARDADVGIAGGKGKGVIFKKGEMLYSVSEDRLLEALMSEIEKL